MTISSTTRTAGPFTGTGVQVAFPFTFKVFASADVLVALTNTATGAVTFLTLGTDYSVVLNADQNASPGGTITTVVAPPSTVTLAATSQVANLQPVDLTNAGGFYPSVLNAALDRATIQIQQLSVRIGGWGGGGSVTPPVTPPTTGASDASSLTYTAGITGAVARFQQAKNQELISVYDFGALGNGVADDTAAINAGTVATAAAGNSLFFPAGTYLATQLNATSKMHWVGENPITTIIKLKSGTNPGATSALVYSASTSIDDIHIEGITFDGNSAGNTQGDTLVLKGARPRVSNVLVINSAGNAVQTDWAGPSFRTGGFEGRFTDIAIDSPQKSGWLHRGPSDSHFDNIMIIDAGAKTNNTYYGMYLDPAGSGSNGRFNNLHHWNRSTATNVALAGVYVGFGGNTFTNCHFEGSNLPLNVPADLNTFSACEYYATRGDYVINMAGGTNQLSGMLWHYAGQPAYTGLNLTGPSNSIDLVVAGDSFTPIAFGDSASGGNFVTINGYLNLPGAPYAGVYSTSDVINISIGGGAGGVLAQGIGNSNFYAYQSSPQSLTATTWLPISCPNVGFDLNQEYNAGTSRFTCKIAGCYQFSASMFFGTPAANTKAVGISKNGTLITSLMYLGSTAQGQLSGTSPAILLAAGDYVEASYYTGVSDTSIPGQAYIFFGGHRIK